MARISVSLDRNADRHDVKLLKRELDTLPGVTSVSVSSGGQLAVDYDATGVRQADILKRSRRWATTSGRNEHKKTGNRAVPAPGLFMFRWRTPPGPEKLLPCRLHSQTPRGELREAGNELFRPARRERRPQADIRAVLRVPHHAAAGDDLQLHPLEEGICAGHVPQRPQAHGADAHGGQGVLGSLGIGPGQSPGPQQHAAEVPCHHAAYVGDALPLEHVQHGLARRALGLPSVVE